MLSRLGSWTRGKALRLDPWTNVYGLARTLLALGTALTLALNPAATLFRPAAGVRDAPVCDGLSRAAFFCLIPAEWLDLGRWIAVVVLLIVASGWRPRLTGPLQWYLSVSLPATAVTIDGGDHVTAVLTLLLLPVALTDSRRSHWQPAPATGAAPPLRTLVARLLALSALLAVRFQVAGIYYHAAVAKLRVEEWNDGTALYYWLLDPAFGAPAWLVPVLRPLLLDPLGVLALTWGSLALEVLLFMALVMPKWAWRYPLALGLLFHLGIAVIQGLGSFWLAMSAALIVYLRPVEQPIRWPRRRTTPASEPASHPSFIALNPQE
jgi:antimicrobial peptide system SdpB family protein